jgi:hypothetical protein
MESRTLAQLEAEVRYLSDTEGLTLRHPSADIRRRVNNARRAYYAMVTANGLPYYLEATTPATLAGTQVSGEQYSEVPWPAGPPQADQIVGVDVASSTTADDWYELRPVTWGSRRYAAGAGSVGAMAGFFAIRRVPQANPADLDALLAGVIAIFPAQTSGAYKITYLPETLDLAADGDLFVALPGGVDWVVWHVVQDLAARDDDQRETYAIASQKLGEAERRVLEAAGRVRSAGPLLPRRRTGLGRRGRRYL